MHCMGAKWVGLRGQSGMEAYELMSSENLRFVWPSRSVRVGG